MKKLTLAIDLDGTIRNPTTDDLMPDTLKVFAIAKKRCWKIIIFTARTDHEWVRQWLEAHGIVGYPITNIKPAATHFIDDKNIRFVSWEQAIRDCLSTL